MLELACGTGRLTLPLARLGVAEELVALDSSAPFVGRLRERLPRSRRPCGTRCAWSRATCALRPWTAFDLIAVPFNSLAYLIAREDRVACLRAARELLAPGGRLAFDIIQPRYDFMDEALQSCPPLRVDVDHPAPEYGVARFMRTYHDVYDALNQTLRSTNRYEIHHSDGRVEHRLRDLDWHIYFPEELELLLESTGLQVVERFGDYERGPWTATSRRYLWLAEAG